MARKTFSPKVPKKSTLRIASSGHKGGKVTKTPKPAPPFLKGKFKQKKGM